MINIKFKIGTIIFALLGAFFIVNYAGAYSVAPLNVNDELENFCYSTDTSEWGILFRSDDQAQQYISPNEQQCGSFTSYAGGQPLGQFLYVIFLNNDVDLFNCLSSGYSWCLTNANGIIDQVSVQNLGYVPPPTNITWGSNGIWGTEVTGVDVQEDIVASVQTTGANLWPLLTFAGVALAFILFLQLVFLTDKSIKPIKSPVFDKEKFNSKANELDAFYKKTGNADPAVIEVIKRKRGRPRKTPL